MFLAIIAYHIYKDISENNELVTAWAFPFALNNLIQIELE